MILESMYDAIGHTPLVRLTVEASPGTEVFAKLELANPFGMKDRVARTIIAEARRLGSLVPGAPIIESSSGTMALGVALAGRSLGHPVHIVTDPRTDPITMAKLLALGCHVEVVPRMTEGGWQGARLARLAELMAELPGAFWPQQYSNPDNPAAYRQLAGELVDELGTVDVLVGSVGSGGSMCGTTRALRHREPSLWAVGVDSVGSALFDQPDVPGRLQSGLGNSLLPKNLDRTVIDEIHWLNDREAFEATRALVREQQIFAGNTSGSVYRVLTDVARRARAGSRVVGLFPDRGDRYAATIYDDDYWAQHQIDRLPLATVPRPVPYGAEVRSWSRAQLTERPGGQRRLLFVEANTSGTGMIALRAAQRLGLRVSLLTSDPGRYAGLAETGAEVTVCDTNSEQRLRATVQDGFRREDLAGVMTTSDFYVPAAAGLSSWLGLPGNSVESVGCCRDKTRMRAALTGAGVPQPRHVVITDPAEAVAAVAAVGLPCVVKPADDSGSDGVLLCHSATQAARHTASLLARRVNVRGLPVVAAVLVEEYIDAPEFSVEMFSQHGEAFSLGVTAKSVTGRPYFVEHRHIYPAPLPASVGAEVVETVRAALKATGFRLGATHTELRLTERGPVVIEINPRLAGGMIPELIRLVSGTDLVEQQIRAFAGLDVQAAVEPAGHAGIQFLLADRSGILREVRGAEAAAAVPGVRQVHATATPGQAVRPPRSAYDRLGHIIAEGTGPAEVATALDAARRLIHFDIDENGGTDDRTQK